MPRKDPEARWGGVDGDVNADAILSDRRAGATSNRTVAIGLGLLVVGSALWFGFTQSHWALALTIVSTGMWVAGEIGLEIYKLYTFEMVTERRVQLLEQDMNAIDQRLWVLDEKLDEILRALKPRPRGGDSAETFDPLNTD